MAKKVGFDASIITKNSVTVDETRASFLNGAAESALIEGTTVVVPAQRAFSREVNVDGEKKNSASVYARIYDSQGSLMEEKAISLSQFTKRTYGTTKIEVPADYTSKGIRGTLRADSTNVVGKPFSQRAEKNADGDWVVVIPESQAFSVGKKEEHYMSKLVQNGDKWDFVVKKENPDYLDLVPRKLPILTSVAVPVGSDNLPDALKDSIGYAG